MSITIAHHSSSTPSTNPTLWLRADKGITLSGNTVSNWADQSGNGYDATQLTLSWQPSVTTTTNGKPALRFDGSNNFLTGSQIPNLEFASITLFVVANGFSQTGIGAGLFTINTFTDGFCFYRRLNAPDLTLYSNNISVSGEGALPITGFNYKILGLEKYYSSEIKLFINGGQVANSYDSTIVGSFTNNNYVLGYFSGFELLKGNIAEVILYNQALSDNNRKAVENYLKIKYAI